MAAMPSHTTFVEVSRDPRRDAGHVKVSTSRFFHQSSMPPGCCPTTDPDADVKEAGKSLLAAELC